MKENNKELEKLTKYLKELGVEPKKVEELKGWN